MDEQIKTLINEINGLIDTIGKSDDEPSQEVLDSIEELTKEIDLLKEKQQVDNSKELLSKLDILTQAVSDGGKLSTDTTQNIVEAIKQIKIDVPQVNIAPAEVNVTVPEVKVPPVNVPPPVIPEPKVYFPDEIGIKKPSWIEGLFDLSVILQGMKAIYDRLGAWKLPTDPQNPVSVRLSNGEKFYNALGGMMSAISGAFPFKKADSTDQAALVRDDGTQVVEVSNLSDITIEAEQINLNTDTLETKLQTLIDQTDTLETKLQSIIDQTVVGTPSHFNGSVGITPVDTITPASNTRSILLENTHATQNILISLDAGSTWKTIRPYGVLSLDVAVASFQVKGSGASTTYEGIYLL